ncbi:MAG TPA: PKD domain-containing protein [Anaerolineae bacterium]|nr:PKD domain-containing protein [Anaerolineae bacterium]
MKIRYLLSTVVLGMFLTSPGGPSVATSIAPMTRENQVDYVRAVMPTARGLEPEQNIAVFSPEPDRDWVGNVFQERRPEFRVNYGHDWVEGEYEAGHTVWITVTEGSSGPIKATAELATGVVPWWGGRTGFSTNWQGWSPDQPDIVPGDWVYGRVDDGHTSTVRVGTINGALDLDNDTISGTIHADWFTQTLNADCGVWEENGPGRSFTIEPDGGTYSCDFSSEWDLLPGQNVGVQYHEPDGDWVINVFREPSRAVRVNQSHNWVEGETTPGSTIVATVWRDGLPVLAGATDSGSDNWWNIGFCCDDEDELQTGDVVEIQTSQGLTASIEIIPMTGAVDANAETLSGQLFGVPFPADVRGEVRTEGGTSVEGVTDGAGNYTLDFGPFDVFPGHEVALWYVRPDGHQVGVIRKALRLDVDTGRDQVEGSTAPGLPVTVTLNGGETVTRTSDANGDFDLDFTGDVAIADTIEAWAGAQYASLVVVPVTADVNNDADVVWGHGPPNSDLDVGVNEDWRWPSTDGAGYYEAQYDWDITPDDDVEVRYRYPTGHETQYRFGSSDVRVNQQTPVWNVVPGDEYSYLIDYSNDARGPATDVVITDALPDSVTYLRDTSGVTPTVDAGSNTLVWHLGALGAHRSETFELRVELGKAAPQDTRLRNRVEISAPKDRDPNNNWSEIDVWPSDPRVDLWVDESLEAGLPIAGEVITYQLHYGNNGNRTAHDVFLTDTLPAGTTFVTTTFEVGRDGLAEHVDAGTVVWDIGALDPGESRQFELAVQLDATNAPGTLLLNQVTVSEDDGGDNRDNRFWHTTVAEPPMADLWVDEEVEGDLSSPENEIVYRITYRNDGTLAAQDVVLTDTLPVSMTHSWHSAGSVATLADGVIVWQLGTVPPGSGGQLLVGAQVSEAVLAEAVFTNTVEISTSTLELDHDNNLAVVPLGSPRVTCVPWAAAQPHPVWSGLTTTLKGTAQGHGLTTFEWDFGDGSPVVAGVVSDPYVIEADHTYSAPPGTVYTATLTVWGAFDWSGTDIYAVKALTPSHGVEVDVAVDKGLWYIHKRASRYKSAGLPFADWGDVADTISAVQAFQLQGHRPGSDPWEDPYVEDVQRGWNTLFTYSKLNAIAVQPAGDPDSDGDGVGIGIYNYYGQAIYESGLVMMALATTGSPARAARTGPPIYVRGQTYYSITQDMADWFAWGQNDDGSGTARGGWRYQPNSGDSDNSNTQFPVLGLAAAEDNWGITVRTWVKDELRDYWLAYTQDSSGGFGYSGRGDHVNVGKAGAGIMDLIWTGVPVTDTRIASAAQFIKEHWDDVPDGDWNGNLGELYAMYAVKKGSQFANIDRYGTHDWDDEYSSYLVGVQRLDGSFEGAGNMAGWQPMNTSWAVMILSPGLYRALPVPIFTHETDSGPAWRKVLFDASASHHTDPDREIVLFEWDFGDGSPAVTAPSSTTSHTYPTQGTYLAMLTVWDDAGNSATRDTEVSITAPEYHPPVADPGGPYSGRIGQEIVLDGSGCYDPDGGMDDAVVLYEWDIAGGRLYTTTKPTLGYTEAVSGTFLITLRVQDRGVDDGFDLPKWSEPATTTVTISEEVSASPDGKEINWLVVVVVAASLTIIAAVLTVVNRRASR